MATNQVESNVPKIEHLKVCEGIAKGGYGIVFKGNWQGSPCAVKKVHLEVQEIFTTGSIDEDERRRTRETFQKECKRSIRLRHPNIVQFFGLYTKPEDEGQGFPSLVMELLHCSLSRLLKPGKGAKPLLMPMQLKLSLLCDVTRGLRYLHNYSPCIIHRDLSSNNVLVSEWMVAKIGDLGTMRFFDPERQSKMSEAPGTALFMPPEASIEPPDYGSDIDIFSFACVALHTLTGKWPTPTEPTKGPSNALIAVPEAKRRIEYLNEIDDADIRGLLVRCLENDRHQRPCITRVCDEMHAFLGKIPNELPPTKLDAYLTIQENTDHIKQLKNDITSRDEQIEEMQVFVDHLSLMV